MDNRVARDIWAVVYITLGILTYLALAGGAGKFGESWVEIFRGMFGIGINIVPALLFIIGIVMLTSKTIQFNFTRVFGITLLIASMLGIVHVSANEDEMWTFAADFGGIVGFVASVFFRLFLGTLGAHIVLFAMFLISLMLTFGFSIRDAIDHITAWITGNELPQHKEEKMKINNNTRAEKEEEEDPAEKNPKNFREAVEKLKAKVDEREVSKLKINRPAELKLNHEFKPQKSRVSDEDWQPPSLDLLDPAVESASMNEEELHKKAEQIKQKLLSFGIGVTMSAVNIGPAVMQYTLKPEEGVKLKSITNLKSDLALALAAKSIRIQAPIPGTNFVGIEIPNDKRVMVRMRELLMSEVFAKTKGNTRLILGRDVAGKAMIGELAQMPHLLVAGQTGSGKSVCINAFLLSLIYQNSPNDLRLILVDPKRVELAPYNGIPHLLTPVINDPEKTVSALKWAVAEMTRRYTEFAKVKVRNIAEYNEYITRRSGGAKDEEGNTPEKMPFIVIVIDELADLMMVASKEVEACICRIAQLARATGIHLIVATQRPSVDVITGLIKANIPTRIAFRVAQGVDSKTILDGVGAEDLLGQGDMLFIPPGQSEPVRVQGAFISTEEVRKVTTAIKLDLGTEEPEYNDEILDQTKTDTIEIPGLQQAEPAKEDDSDDTIVLKAARVVLETKRASTSLLQRRLSLGYARAARIIDLMEERGFVGPADGAKPRAIYVTAEKLAELEAGSGIQTRTDERRIADALNDMEDERTA